MSFDQYDTKTDHKILEPGMKKNFSYLNILCGLYCCCLTM